MVAVSALEPGNPASTRPDESLGWPFGPGAPYIVVGLLFSFIASISAWILGPPIVFGVMMGLFWFAWAFIRVDGIVTPSVLWA